MFSALDSDLIFGDAIKEVVGRRMRGGETGIIEQKGDVEGKLN